MRSRKPEKVRSSRPMSVRGLFALILFSFVDVGRTQGSGNALDFNGTTSDYVIINPINNFPATTITISFWMNTSDASEPLSHPLSYLPTAGNTNIFLIVDYRNFYVWINGQSSSSNKSGISANDGKWHHIAVTWRSFDGQLKFYKDGVDSFTDTF